MCMAIYFQLYLFYIFVFYMIINYLILGENFNYYLTLLLGLHGTREMRTNKYLYLYTRLFHPDRAKVKTGLMSKFWGKKKSDNKTLIEFFNVLYLSLLSN